MTMPNMRQMDLEYRAWRSFCKEMEQMGVTDLNDERWNPTMNAVRRWAEELALLRLSQPEVDALRAVGEARAAYPELVDE